MDRLQRSKAQDTARIRAVILSDDVSDDDSIDDGTESDENYVEPRESGAECTDDTTSGDDSCGEMDSTDSCFHRKGQDEVW